MKSSSKKILAAAVTLVLLAAVALSETGKWDHPHHGHGGMITERSLGFFSDYLNLTDDQQTQMKGILAQEKSAMKPMFQQMADSHRGIRQIVQSGAFDEAKVRSIAAQQTQAMQEMIVQKARVESQLFQILSPDQKSKMTQFMDKHEQRFMKHMQEPPPPPQPE